MASRQKGIYWFSEDKGDYTELSRFHLWETDAATIALMMRGVNRTGQYDPQLSGILVHRKPETIPYFKEVKEILVESIVRNV